jgi:hypothetical protein
MPLPTIVSDPLLIGSDCWDNSLLSFGFSSVLFSDADCVVRGRFLDNKDVEEDKIDGDTDTGQTT